jgi:hypothetical protein
MEWWEKLVSIDLQETIILLFYQGRHGRDYI